jgi:hypothetical protein
VGAHAFCKSFTCENADVQIISGHPATVVWNIQNYGTAPWSGVQHTVFNYS